MYSFFFYVLFHYITLTYWVMELGLHFSTLLWMSSTNASHCSWRYPSYKSYQNLWWVFTKHTCIALLYRNASNGIVCYRNASEWRGVFSDLNPMLNADWQFLYPQNFPTLVIEDITRVGTFLVQVHMYRVLIYTYIYYIFISIYIIYMNIYV